MRKQQSKGAWPQGFIYSFSQRKIIENTCMPDHSSSITCALVAVGKNHVVVHIGGEAALILPSVP